jgi:hypothetical protein
MFVCRSLSLHSDMFTLNARESMLHSTPLKLDTITYLWHYRPEVVVDKRPRVLGVPLDSLYMLIDGYMCDIPVLFQACASVVSPRERRGQQRVWYAIWGLDDKPSIPLTNTDTGTSLCSTKSAVHTVAGQSYTTC